MNPLHHNFHLYQIHHHHKTKRMEIKIHHHHKAKRMEIKIHHHRNKRMEIKEIKDGKLNSIMIIILKEWK